MTITELLTGGGGILFVIFTLLQIAPVKIDPWSFIAKAVGNAMNKDIVEKIEGVEDRVKDLAEKQDIEKKEREEKDMDACRGRILRFGDECRRKMKHSEEFFNQILADISDYEQYCESHPEYKNDKAKLTIEKIRSTYKKVDDENAFL